MDLEALSQPATEICSLKRLENTTKENLNQVVEVLLVLEVSKPAVFGSEFEDFSLVKKLVAFLESCAPSPDGVHQGVSLAVRQRRGRGFPSVS